MLPLSGRKPETVRPLRHCKFSHSSVRSSQPARCPSDVASAKHLRHVTVISAPMQPRTHETHTYRGIRASHCRRHCCTRRSEHFFSSRNAFPPPVACVTREWKWATLPSSSSYVSSASSTYSSMACSESGYAWQLTMAQ